MQSHPLYFIRHGQTDWNAENRLQGQQDIPLNEKGREQALRNGATLADHLPDPACYALYVSPMLRTRQTCHLMLKAAKWDLPPYAVQPQIEEQLIELTFGDWEGQTMKEIGAMAPDLAKAREEDKWNMVPPEGESYAMLSSRIIPFLKQLSGPSILVSHGCVLRVVRQYLEQHAPHEAAFLETPQDQIYLWDGSHSHWL
ncbi:MAG: histidine phosphatase family protein [Cohaesibacter sp.]|jgi:probable phosphoglycerate mutase|nr:histidine phosphatase family protein [Cohaesibacter sp.]